MDRPTRITYADNSYAETEYDANGNPTTVDDPAGNEITNTYDDLNRLTARNIDLAGSFLDTTSESYSYDALNRMTEAEDNDYSVQLTYGVRGLTSSVYQESQQYVSGSAYTKTVTHTRDAVGNLATLTYPSGLSLSYSYNDIDRLSAVSDGTNTIASFGYIGTRLKTIEFQNGTTQTNTYGGLRQDLTSIEHETSTPSTILRLDYGYDDVHDRLYERHGASGSSGDAYEYDKAGRLVTAWMRSDTPSDPTSDAYVQKIDYDYDDVGNRTAVAVTPYGQGAESTAYTSNSLNQYGHVGDVYPTHNDNGSLTFDGVLTYEYNYRNLICRVKNGANTVATYRYDALGRRVEKSVSGGGTERYIYAGGEVVATYDGSNNWRQNFAFGQGIGTALMLEQADVLDYDGDSNTSEVTRSFYHRNALGSVVEITDMNQEEVVSYSYDPYGSMTITVGGTPQQADPMGQHWGFARGFSDEESGLWYFRSRYYSAALGRFLQRDPIGLAAGANVYEYSYSAPSVWTDPLGLTPDDDTYVPPKPRRDRHSVNAIYAGKWEKVVRMQRNYQDRIVRCKDVYYWSVPLVYQEDFFRLRRMTPEPCGRGRERDKEMCEEVTWQASWLTTWMIEVSEWNVPRDRPALENDGPWTLDRYTVVAEGGADVKDGAAAFLSFAAAYFAWTGQVEASALLWAASSVVAAYPGEAGPVGTEVWVWRPQAGYDNYVVPTGKARTTWSEKKLQVIAHRYVDCQGGETNACSPEGPPGPTEGAGENPPGWGGEGTTSVPVPVPTQR